MWPLGRDLGEERRLGRSLSLLLHVDGNDDFLNRLANLHKLRGAGLRVRLQPAPLGPLVGLAPSRQTKGSPPCGRELVFNQLPVVVIDVAEQQAGVGPVNDEPDVAAHAHRPEAPVPRLVELVKAQPRTRRIYLQIERRRLHALLLVAGEPREAVCECVGDSEVHRRCALWLQEFSVLGDLLGPFDLLSLLGLRIIGNPGPASNASMAAGRRVDDDGQPGAIDVPSLEDGGPMDPATGVEDYVVPCNLPKVWSRLRSVPEDGCLLVWVFRVRQERGRLHYGPGVVAGRAEEAGEIFALAYDLRQPGREIGHSS